DFRRADVHGDVGGGDAIDDTDDFEEGSVVVVVVVVVVGGGGGGGGGRGGDDYDYHYDDGSGEDLMKIMIGSRRLRLHIILRRSLWIKDIQQQQEGTPTMLLGTKQRKPPQNHQYHQWHHHHQRHHEHLHV
ncbi:MAG: hypothetical protein MI717_00650, partial [Spirochaetales bacterium]|nr:hypothetical protein [Spirochaetales bacterium]